MKGKSLAAPVLPQHVDEKANAVLAALEMSTSPLLRSLTVNELRSWAVAAVVRIFPIGEVLQREGASERTTLDRSVRVLYVLVSGQVTLCKRKEDRSAAEMHLDSEDLFWRDPLAPVAATSDFGAVFGETQVWLPISVAWTKSLHRIIQNPQPCD